MTVREALEMMSYGTKWRLIGAMTGKKICDYSNSEKLREKYMDLETTDHPFVADFKVNANKPFTDYILPMISIWVSGV